MRVFLGFGIYGIFGFLANRKVYDPFGELVHVARARRCLSHTFEYGAPRLGLQIRSSMPAKLSHYQLPAFSKSSNRVRPKLIAMLRAWPCSERWASLCGESSSILS